MICSTRVTKRSRVFNCKNIAALSLFCTTQNWHAIFFLSNPEFKNESKNEKMPKKSSKDKHLSISCVVRTSLVFKYRSLYQRCVCVRGRSNCLTYHLERARGNHLERTMTDHSVRKPPPRITANWNQTNKLTNHTGGNHANQPIQWNRSFSR